MTIHLGNTSETVFDFSSGYGVPVIEPPDCSTDTSLWIRSRGENGRCYAVCTADPSQSFEVDPRECGLSTTTANRTATSSTAAGSDQIIKGVPNWVLAATGIVLFVAMTN